MQALELTKEQKNKLLEMCKALFPEYTDLEVRDSMEDLCLKQDSLFIEYGRRTGEIRVIHWFEFCMTHLVNTLFTNIDYHDSPQYDCNLHVELTLAILNHKIHPIDYLYEQFKTTSK